MHGRVSSTFVLVLVLSQMLSPSIACTVQVDILAISSCYFMLIDTGGKKHG